MEIVYTKLAIIKVGEIISEMVADEELSPDNAPVAYQILMDSVLKNENIPAQWGL